MVGPKARRAAAKFLHEHFSASERRSARVLGLNRSTLFYQPRPSRDEELSERMKALAARHRRFGLPRIYYFLKQEGSVRSKSRAERVYRSLNLQIKKRKRQKLAPAVRVPFEKAAAPNEIWSFDFMFDYTDTKRKLKILTIVDDCSKKSPGLLAEYSIPSSAMISFFDSLPKLPSRLRCDNGPEMTSIEFLAWAHKRKISIEHIDPGKPNQNAYIESFNSRLRDEHLTEEVFLDLEDAKKKIEKWRREYNQTRPHSALGMKTPNQFEEEFKNNMTQRD